MAIWEDFKGSFHQLYSLKSVQWWCFVPLSMYKQLHNVLTSRQVIVMSSRSSQKALSCCIMGNVGYIVSGFQNITVSPACECVAASCSAAVCVKTSYFWMESGEKVSRFPLFVVFEQSKELRRQRKYSSCLFLDFFNIVLACCIRRLKHRGDVWDHQHVMLWS